MTKRYKAMTADEFAKELAADPEYQERKRAREAHQASLRQQYDADQKELVDEINAAGVSITRVSDLVPMRTPYRAAIPILLDHLDRPHMPGTRDMIARALAVPEAEYAHDRILAQLRKDVESAKTDNTLERVLDGLTIAVSLTTSKDRLLELLDLAKDVSLGDSRLLFLLRLRRSKDPKIVQGLIELASDPFFQKEIKSWKGFVKKHDLKL